MTKQSLKKQHRLILSLSLVLLVLAGICVPAVRACLTDSGISLVNGELPGGG